MKHSTVDIETLATDANAVILSVGACKFDPYSDDDPTDGRHWKLDIDEQFSKGRDSSDGTIKWWSRQKQCVQDEAFSEDDRIPVLQFLKEFNQWLRPSSKLWAQGPLFDIIILEDLYNMYDYKYNWAYWQIMDSRTLFNLMPNDPRKEIQVDPHNALADALSQSVCVQRAISYLLEKNDD